MLIEAYYIEKQNCHSIYYCKTIKKSHKFRHKQPVRYCQHRPAQTCPWLSTLRLVNMSKCHNLKQKPVVIPQQNQKSGKQTPAAKPVVQPSPHELPK